MVRATVGNAYDVGDIPEQWDLSDIPVVCPVCRQVHERCVFIAGSVYCVRPGCQSPHHRQPPTAIVARVNHEDRRDR